jgi:hypothetical protein
VKRPVLVAILIGTALAAVMTWPLIARPGSVARIDTNDGRYSLWNVAWVAHALTTDAANLFNANIFYPHKGTLAYSDANLVAGAMAVPVYLITGNPIAAHNLVVFDALVLAFLATWQLVRRFTGDPWLALVPATGFAFSAFVSAHTAHIQLLMLFVIPVALLAFHRYVEAPSWRRASVLGLALGLAGLACGQYGIMSGLLVGLGALWFARRDGWRRYWLGLALAVVVTGAIVGPPLVPFLELRSGGEFRSGLNVEEARMFSADASAYLRSTSMLYRPATPETGEPLFPGVLLLAFAAAGIVAARRRATAEPAVPAITLRLIAFYATITALAAWASFGPDGGLYTVLAKTVPLMSFVRTPARFGPVVLLGLAVLAGVGLRAWLPRRHVAWLAPLLVLAVAVEVKTQWSLRDVPPVPEAYRTLARLPSAPVVEFQFPYKQTDLHNHARSMFWSMWHWRPLVNGYSDYIPQDFRDIASPINGFPNPEAFAILRDRHVRYVVLHLETYNPEARKIMLDRFPPYADYVRPLVQDGNVWLYEIVKYP